MARRTVIYLLLAFSMVIVPFTARPLRAAAPVACTEQVANGGFESDGSAWQTTSAGGYALISPILPRTGQWGAILGAYDNANDELAQTITLPAGATLTLHFWWQMTTLEPNHPWDTLDVTVAPAGGGTAIRLFRITDGNIAGDWQPATFDLAPYAGQTVRLAFRAQTDSDQPTDFYLDDISIEACPTVTATPTATAAATATPTATFTATPSPTATLTATEMPTVTPSPTATHTPTATIHRGYLPIVLR